MALTPSFKETVVARVERDPRFAKALLDEAATLFLNEEPETARVILRDLVNANIVLETLAKLTDTPTRVCIGCSRPKETRVWITWRASSRSGRQVTG
jgi:hypothetical protein